MGKLMRKGRRERKGKRKRKRGTYMQSEIVKETEQLRREIGIVGNLSVNIFLERCSNLKKKDKN